MMLLQDLCEGRGSGIDRVATQLELHQRMPPLFETPPGFKKAVLFAPRLLEAIGKDERILACYWHACLKYVQSEPANSATASRLLKEAVQGGCLVPYDPAVARSQMKYLPWWAVRGRGS